MKLHRAIWKKNSTIYQNLLKPFFTLSLVHGKKLGLSLGLAYDLKSNISTFRLQANRAEGNLKEKSKSLLEVTSPQHPLFHRSTLT